jgi:hypothetical protein
MKCLRQLALGCIGVLMVVSLAAAQQEMRPVVRLGDWVEVGNELFMNIITSIDIRYQTTQDPDFESRIQDRTGERDPHDTRVQSQECDCMWIEARLGADFRYGKNLQAQILFEHQSIYDGSLSDGRSATDGSPGGTDRFGNPPLDSEQETVNLERVWIDYQFPNTPVGFRAGFDIWDLDQAGFITDDDPRFLLYARFGPQEEWELGVSAVIQQEATRLGLTNDNDYVYYTFSVAYNMKPHRIAVDGAYSRDRFTGAQFTQGGEPTLGQKIDSVVIMPSWTGTIGPFSGLLQGAVHFGTADGATTAVPPRREYDIFSWAVASYAQVRLGPVAPFVGFLYASGDDDATDNKLEGFYPLTRGDSGSDFAGPGREHLERATALAGRDVTVPARATTLSPNAGLVRALGGGGNLEWGHTVSNWFNDRIGTLLHPGMVTALSNPGVMIPFGGLQIFPVKGHELTFWYAYRAMVDTALLEQASDTPISIDKHQYHNMGAMWFWTLNRHFDLRLAGNVNIAGDGAKAIAATVDCRPDVAGVQPCQGEDLHLWGEARIRARF